MRLIALLIGIVMPMQAWALSCPSTQFDTFAGVTCGSAYTRQVSSAMAVNTADGTVTWTYPTPFVNTPVTCWYTMAASSTTYTFDYPIITSSVSNTTSVALKVTAHPTTLSIGSLSLPINLTLTGTGVPAGTTITFSCLAPS